MNIVNKITNITLYDPMAKAFVDFEDKGDSRMMFIYLNTIPDVLFVVKNALHEQSGDIFYEMGS